MKANKKKLRDDFNVLIMLEEVTRIVSPSLSNFAHFVEKKETKT